VLAANFTTVHITLDGKVASKTQVRRPAKFMQTMLNFRDKGLRMCKHMLFARFEN